MNTRINLVRSMMLAFSMIASAQAVESGQTAPKCMLPTVAGSEGVDLQNLRGKVVYVDFWASWCPPCAQSFPFMNKLDHELRARGLQVVGINVDAKAEDVKSFLVRRPAQFAVSLDPTGSCAQEFGVTAMPSSYLIDRKGVVRHVHLGFRPGEAESLRSIVEQLLSEDAPHHAENGHNTQHLR